jgi:hypothetical protein
MALSAKKKEIARRMFEDFLSLLEAEDATPANGEGDSGVWESAKSLTGRATPVSQQIREPRKCRPTRHVPPKAPAEPVSDLDRQRARNALRKAGYYLTGAK